MGSYGDNFKEANISRFEKDIDRDNSLNVDINFGFLDQNDNQVFVDAINAISAESSELTEADYTVNDIVDISVQRSVTVENSSCSINPLIGLIASLYKLY